MTAYEIYEQINDLAIDPKTGYHVVDELIQAYYYSDRVPGVIVYIQEVFKCDEDMAKEVFEIFKKENAPHLLTPEQAAANQTACEMDRLSQQNKPECPFCQSVNIKKISFTKKVLKTALFGVLGAVDDAGKTYQCCNCGSKF